MKITGMRLAGIRCFEDTDELFFGEKFNLIVGQNNAGKLTLLRALLHLQKPQIDGVDLRLSSQNAWMSLKLTEIKPTDTFNSIHYSVSDMRINIAFRGNCKEYVDLPYQALASGGQLFSSNRPHHQLVPFLAKRKSSGFSEAISSGAHSPITGTLLNLYASVDVLATNGHPKHATYIAASERILGLKITTQPSNSGKVAGFYRNDGSFITLDRMGDGVAEIVALITELCLSKDKIFILEGSRLC
jgi:energy-coupling factor transporter ATP-binding protein EcfA2